MDEKGFPWQGSFRDVPANIRAALSSITSNLVIVAATKKIPVQTIANGQYAHLGLTSEEGKIAVTPSVLPDTEVGKYAGRNRSGWEVKRTDLPKITKTFSWETPNFGDASTYGTHTHYQDREVYQVEAFEPRMFPIKVELLNEPADIAFVKFEVGHILDKTAPAFENDLLFCLNLLQESTGVVGVHASTATREEFIGATVLDWEIFPPGQAGAVIASMTKGSGGGFAPDKAAIATARLKLFNELPVERFIRGASHFSEYIGALYADDLVVFENMTYGNALYVLYDNWQDVSKRSRLELLRGTSEKFDRIVHTDGWEKRFLELVQDQLVKRGRLRKRR